MANISPEAKQRQISVGMKNLEAYRKRRAELERISEAAMQEFRAGVLEELGHKPSATELALLESACASYLVIMLAGPQLRASPRTLVGVKSLADQITAHQNTLLRCLRALRGVTRVARGMAVPTMDDLLAPHRLDS